MSSAACDTCLGCANTGPCADAAQVCNDRQDCQDFFDCLNTCNDEVCTEGCANANPMGSKIFLVGQSCLFCQCPNSCSRPDLCTESDFACDDGTVSDVSSAACVECITCGSSTVCLAERDACARSMGCTEILDCVNSCISSSGDIDACTIKCTEGDPPGTALFMRFALCAACDQCPFKCSGSSMCN